MTAAAEQWRKLSEEAEKRERSLVGQERRDGSAIAWAGRRILLVEDDAIVGLDIRAILEGAGCLMLGQAANISEALAVVASTKIDGAVLDINLGGELSYSVADALAAKSVPFMIMTGYSADRLPEAHRQRPILAKPFQAHEFLAALGRAIAAQEHDGVLARGE